MGLKLNFTDPPLRFVKGISVGASNLVKQFKILRLNVTLIDAGVQKCTQGCKHIGGKNTLGS